MQQSALGTSSLLVGRHQRLVAEDSIQAPRITAPQPGESIIAYLQRTDGKVSLPRYKQILGAANTYKEGDDILGVAAPDEESRRHAQSLLGNTRLQEIDQQILHDDRLRQLLRQGIDVRSSSQTSAWTLGKLKVWLLNSDESAIRAVMSGLTSEVIGCVVKLMSNQELIAVGSKIFNPLPHSNVGAKGYLGARIQPNSPTDNVDDIRWQVFDAFAYAVGDVLLGTNPVSSDVESVAAVQRTLQEVLRVFEIDHVMPHCVLSHIDVQFEAEKKYPGSTELWFQSIAGCDEANATFDISTEKMVDYAGQRNGRFGLYFETGQGADFTNGHGHGFDMVLHEARKYGFARRLSQVVSDARKPDGHRPWVHLNDVAGFIGPEVFRTRDQLVRCCLEDIVMGKLHGLCLGLDICSTLHMDVSLADLDWCIDQIMPANPAYLMALPTKIDPMLGYLTTGFQDHVRVREQFGYRVDDAMWQFFQSLRVIDGDGNPTEHFGDPTWVFLQFQRRSGDQRSDAEIIREGKEQMAAVRSRGVFLAEGYGATPSELEAGLATDVQRIYEDGKDSIWAELDPQFIKKIPDQVLLATCSEDRTDYILHPESGEQLSDSALAMLARLRRRHAGTKHVQIVISDGLNAHSIMDPGHLDVFLKEFRAGLAHTGLDAAEENLVINSGRVRAGYRVGEALFRGLTGQRAILHLIGERPGTGHHTFSVYITAPDGSVWSTPGKVDHNITKVVSGIASTALLPSEGVKDALKILRMMV